ncbi:MAG: hypothetical protein JNK63_06015 [Chthonomonas sp.]|nr:hypothetical protein [Chthonomonas sp.]
MNRLIYLAIGAILLAGCQPQQSVVEPKDEHVQRETTTTPIDPTGSTGPTATTEPKETEQDPAKTTEEVKKQLSQREAEQSRPVQVLVAKPGSNGWVPAGVEVAAFAVKLDKATENWKQVAGSFEMTLQNTKVKGKQIGTFLIEDKSLYKIDYVDVDYPTGPNLMRADGTNRTIHNGSKPVKKMPLGQKGEAPDVKHLHTLFSRQIFETLTEGRPTWEPVIDHLKKSGFKVTLESKNMESGGVMRPFYRLIATKPGIGLNAFEARFDGIRLVPLTIRVNATEPNNKPIVAEWRAIWNFNQKVKDRLVTKKP